MSAQPQSPGAKTERRPLKPRLVRLGLELGLVLLVLVGVNAWQTRNHLSRQPAPDFELSSLGGSTVSLESLRGKRVLLHFWATWCGVCKLELAGLSAVHARLGPDEALITVVADADDREAVARFVAERELRYPVLLADERVLGQYRVSAFPTSYFIAPDGRVSSVSVGLSTRLAYRVRLWLAR